MGVQVQVHGAAVGCAGGGAAVGRAGEGAAVGRAGGRGARVQAPRCGARARAAAGASRRIALYDTLVSVLGSSGHRGFGASGFAQYLKSSQDSPCCKGPVFK